MASGAAAVAELVASALTDTKARRCCLRAEGQIAQCQGPMTHMRPRASWVDENTSITDLCTRLCASGHRRDVGSDATTAIAAVLGAQRGTDNCRQCRTTSSIPQRTTCNSKFLLLICTADRLGAVCPWVPGFPPCQFHREPEYSISECPLGDHRALGSSECSGLRRYLQQTVALVEGARMMTTTMQAHKLSGRQSVGSTSALAARKPHFRCSRGWWLPRKPMSACGGLASLGPARNDHSQYLHGLHWVTASF